MLKPSDLLWLSRGSHFPLPWPLSHPAPLHYFTSGKAHKWGERLNNKMSTWSLLFDITLEAVRSYILFCVSILSVLLYFIHSTLLSCSISWTSHQKLLLSIWNSNIHLLNQTSTSALLLSSLLSHLPTFILKRNRQPPGATPLSSKPLSSDSFHPFPLGCQFTTARCQFSTARCRPRLAACGPF